MCRSVLLIAFCCIAFLQCLCQTNAPKITFGDVKPRDFKPTVYSIDSSAGAIVLADIGNCKYEGNNKGGLTLVYNRIKRIRVLNANGFPAATEQIVSYTDGTFSGEEKLDNFEAATYNLVSGNVVATKLDKTAVFKDKDGKNYNIRKFTFPNVKEGSIIEYRYTLSSPYFRDINPWVFQTGLPCLWSEFAITIPNDLLDFVLLKHGFLPYDIDTATHSRQSYLLSVNGLVEDPATFVTISSGTVTPHWAIKNIPALVEQPYITSLDNYASRLDFQLRRIKYSQSDIFEYLGNWKQLVKKLNGDEHFGVEIAHANNFLDNDLKAVTESAATALDKAKAWYDFVRDNFSWNEENSIKLSKGLKKTWQDKNGNAADINILLMAGLRNLRIESYPAILSTRDNGKASEMYPFIGQYNYVICSATIDGVQYMLDATNKMLGFGQLPEKAYNESARLLRDTTALIQLSADSLNEPTLTTVFIGADDGGTGIAGSHSTTLGPRRSIELREQLRRQAPASYFAGEAKKFPFETSVTGTQIDSLSKPGEPITVKYNFSLNTQGQEVIYINPMLAEGYKENPFKAADRIYPVEMPYCKDEIYVFSMDVPAGYKVDEIPKSTRFKLNESDGLFEYIIGERNGKIQMRCRVKLNKANFETADYQSLRGFFAAIVQKEAEQIVLKKI